MKLYIGGKQARPDSGYSMEVRGAKGEFWAKLRWAIARTFATPWKRRARLRPGQRATAHKRAQVLYYMAENLSLRQEEIIRRLAGGWKGTGGGKK